MSTPRPLRIWAVSDGRAGMEAQAVGLAEAVARRRPAIVTVKRIGWRWGLGRLPWPLIPNAALTGDAIGAPWPDIWIATGRATLPLSTRVLALSGGKTFVVQTQDPRARLDRFDLVIPPTHDRLEGPNVVPILGAPNRVTPEMLQLARAQFADRLDGFAGPRIALIVGGKSKAHDLPPTRAAELAQQVCDAVLAAQGSLLVSYTRRTPAPAQAAMNRVLSDLPGWIWDGTGDNPYFAFLAAADAILVTADSTNLATDAAATGKPVFILPITGESPKLARFHADLAARGIARPFAGRFDAPAYEPLMETDRAALELLLRYDGQP